jgi:hypothetical protein
MVSNMIGEMRDAVGDLAALQQDLERRFREALGVKVAAQAVERGALDRHTGLSQPRRSSA